MAMLGSPKTGDETSAAGISEFLGRVRLCDVPHRVFERLGRMASKRETRNSTERVHIPPVEKELHRLKIAFFKGIR